MITGYKKNEGLYISLLSLEEKPEIKSTILLANRFESEGRSHAFNAILKDDESSIMGLPTVKREESAGRWWWYSDSSDINFLAASSQLILSKLGTLTASEESEHEEYECDVSCIDWYGNARPIFTNNRLFALSGTELIEGNIANEKIVEIDRVNLTNPLEATRTDSLN